MAASEVALYPWSQLDAIPRQVLERHRACMDRIADAVDFEGLVLTLPTLLQLDDLRLTTSSPCDSATRPPSLGVDIELTTISANLRIALSVQPAFVLKVVNSVLKRTPGPQDPRATLDDRIQGFFAGLVLEACHRCSHGLPLTLATASSPTTEWGVLTHVALNTSGETYGCSLWVQGTDDDLAAPRRQMAELRQLPVALPICVGVGVAERAELEALAPGDIWLPGDGLWLTTPTTGRGALAAPGAEGGVEVELVEHGVVYRGEPVSLPLDVTPEVTMSKPNDRSSATTPGPLAGAAQHGRAKGETPVESDNPTTLNDTVLDSPVVVRLELGTITLPARQWAELRPGDILETARPVGASVNLRVAGQTVGEGQLVNVDGQLGIRVSKITR